MRARWFRANEAMPGDYESKFKSVATNRRGSDVMRRQQINRVSGKILLVLSLTALLAVLSGYARPPQPDEGAAAHIFQLSIVALVPITLLFLATAGWKERLRSARPLAFSAAALVLAFGALFYLEHYR
jgi:energy-coupling factor transporter transmembrane protein EcfT